MKVILEVEVEKRPTNEVEGDAWQPSTQEVASELYKGVRYLDDTGWVVTSVAPAEDFWEPLDLPDEEAFHQAEESREEL